MPRVGRVVALWIIATCASALRAPAQPPAAVVCTEWHECERLALAAADGGDYERFHDLAWRAVQTGPRNDPALMYLLARAQSLSGRPHDALVMLGRLADAHTLPPEALTSPDFARAHQLPGWEEFEARVAGVPANTPENAMLPPAPTPTPAPTPAAPAPGPAPSVKEPAAPPPAAASAALLSPPIEARRFRTDAFSVAGIAYDGVSQRFLFGDHLGRKLRVVSDRSDHSVDLARAESGGFRDIAALAIDDRRGDLWVASAGEGDTSGLLHKLQLISGRPLKSFPISADGHPVQPADLAVAPSGTILVLDAGSPRLLALRPGRTDLELITRLEDSGPASVTIGKDEDIAYVAHGHEIARVMMHGGRTTALPFREKIALGRLECIRLYRRSIIAIERNGESRRVLRLELNDRGTAIDKVVPLAEQLPATGRISAAIADDALVYVIDGDPSAPSSAGDVVVYRVALL